jgi:hypothetical protein
LFDHAGVHLEHWVVELPRTKEGIGTRKVTK